MLAEANREIRLAFDTANAQRLAQQRFGAPMAYIDELIRRLEELQLKGTTELPRKFKSRLDRATELLPPGAAAPSSWPRRTARVIDRCFDLQERVLLAQRRLHHADRD
jgi:hypothetical protein